MTTARRGSIPSTSPSPSSSFVMVRCCFLCGVLCVASCLRLGKKLAGEFSIIWRERRFGGRRRSVLLLLVVVACCLFFLLRIVVQCIDRAVRLRLWPHSSIAAYRRSSHRFFVGRRTKRDSRLSSESKKVTRVIEVNNLPSSTSNNKF